VAPVPASKKFWIFDGSVAQYPSVLNKMNSVHWGECTYCHGGTDSGTDRATAHSAGFDPFAASSACELCHASVVTEAGAGLHTTLGGYDYILAQRGFGDVDPAEAQARFEKQCTKCHTADPAAADPMGQTNCGQCHVSVPATAGGGLLAGHAFQMTPSMDNNCTACHGSRVKDEYYGQNNDLLGRNKTAFGTGSPWKDASFTLAPDVHKQAGYDCVFCHEEAEMHGSGHPVAGTGDRYDVTTAPACETCHDALVGGNDFHSAIHFANLDCQVCHTQPYKNCFNCHTDVTSDGVAFYKINQGDPTLAARKAASSAPDSVAPDALMTFRAGNNPRFGEAGQKRYAVLRHVPVDRDVFAYTGDNALAGLIPEAGTGAPDMGSSPTWKRATPHSIARQTAITSSCYNCHSTVDFSFQKDPRFWLTDPVADAEGWVPSQYEADERAANAGLVLDSPMGAPTLIDAATLQGWIDAGFVNGTGPNRVVILDVRSSEGTDYIPGAQWWAQGSQAMTRVDGPAPAVNEVLDGPSMDAMIQSHGIDADTTIVITAPGTSASYVPSRAYFTFRYWGFPKSRLKVLNGYNAAWTTFGGVTQAATTATPSTFSVKDLGTFSPGERAGLSEMMAMVEAGTGVPVDMRGDKTAAGSTTGVFSDVAGDYVVFEGTPKGGTWFNYADFQAGGGDPSFKSAAEIRGALEAAGVDGTKTVLSYCRTAYIASTGYFVLDAILGWDVMVFDGSWSLWGKLSTVDTGKGGELPSGSPWAVDNATYMESNIVYNTDSAYTIESLQLDATGAGLDPTTPAANQVEVEDADYVGYTSGGTGGGGTTPGTGGSGGGC
jgi:3-mercaptopyruvate sulfurtransferase SseA